MDHQGRLHPLLGHFRYHHQDPWEATYGRPLRLYNQHFGNGILEEELPPLDTWALMHPHPRSVLPHRESSVSQISCNKDQFEVKLDVHQFHPSELTIKVVENYVVVEGRHDEKEDEHGLISRNFKRRYRLPENVLDEDIICELSSNGVLIIRVPRKIEAHHDPHAAKIIPIIQTGRPAVSSGLITPKKDSGHHFHDLGATKTDQK